MSLLPSHLGLPPFRERPPWLGGDLQTVRDIVRSRRLPPDPGEEVLIEVGPDQQLVGVLETPPAGRSTALVVVLHGLGGCSDGPGPRRLARSLGDQGFAVLRLNLRGAGRGRARSRGTYAALCNGDLRPVLRWARQWCLARACGADPDGLPLFGAGISLGGTVLLNGCLDPEGPGTSLLDGLVCISSPLDLLSSVCQFERRRNRIYQRWLVKRLSLQTLADPFGLSPSERSAIEGPCRVRTVRGFDAAITAPRWGYGSVEEYYATASPLGRLQAGGSLPPTLLLLARDDPWVPLAPLQRLMEEAPGGSQSGIEAVVTPHGGHNGFHAPGDGAGGSWADRLAVSWLLRLSQAERPAPLC